MASSSSSSARLLRRSGASFQRAWSRTDGSIPTSYNVLSRRFMATEATIPTESTNESDSCVKVFESRLRPARTRQQILLDPSPVTTTLYKFPTLEPIQFVKYDAKFLHLPLRRDILHRAIVYEGNAHRLGRAKTKYRSEIVGSGKKLRPQKGTGRARLGDVSSPMLRGGAKAHGPKPRDFRTDLPKKIYDLAFRTALSYRYRQGQLIVIGEAIHPQHSKTRYMRQIMLLNKWGAPNGKTLFITMTRRNNLWCGLNMLGQHGRAMKVQDVDVKDLLETGRIVIEQHALEWLGERHGVSFPPRVKKSKKGKKGAVVEGESEAAAAVVEEGDAAAIAAVATASEAEAAVEALAEEPSTGADVEASPESDSQTASEVTSAPPATSTTATAPTS
ncbi:54S ribosomal protein, mitochondrial, variant 3 [Orbilia oligospora]|uniref:Large ribosomal subunit protein uL4m n=2 Tax=Orbilia oligospora TaxID=2813651 RepID=A0A7C8PKD0_ORBOL|nr:54S ribosomal protein, mitochondrial [Orbilia oligospora]KAF3184626.1 54S ribosomal protein, mitochondrial [Orbilia oligospora]KAF3184628.1 54S ribosomal protein, mitochondrial, variant 3 [Orbilia oligospora]KAF3236089.1 54S ribosomal protein, mitochondrial [Orbilia oligospora]KAF3236091.1 54S ribosomal protein, mitochondrial, variant 3 [Orbilia oligospora]